MRTQLSTKRFIVIDLGSGEYTLSNIGHEKFNLDKNPITGTYLGYCPSHDDIDTTQLGAKKREDNVSDILVVYVRKLKDCNDREIIAFTDSANIYSSPQSGKGLQRVVFEKGNNVDCTYTIESNRMYNLGFYPLKFIIHINEYENKMFRRQRFYKGKYPKLDKEIIAYLENYLLRLDADEDFEFQKEVNDSDFEGVEGKNNYPKEEPQYTNGTKGLQVAKKAIITKTALRVADCKCEGNPLHTTFLTKKNQPYMEGHHLIPCTASNSEYCWEKFHVNIDCVENIVCLCPTCHRKIHYGNEKEKMEILTLLYGKQIEKLKFVGLNISLDELMNLYR